MKLAAVRLFRYCLPLRRPLLIGNIVVSQRSGLVLELQNNDGGISVGEVSPLPGLNREDIVEAQTQLSAWAHHAIGRDIACKPDLAAGFWGCVNVGSLSPSVRFGIEGALLGFQAAACVKNNLKLCGLIFGTQDDVCRRAEQLFQDGFRAFKLKVGRDELSADVKTATLVRQIIGGTSTLRLDANRLWGVEQAHSFASAALGLNIEFIEEPVCDISSLKSLLANSSISYALPIALDQSLCELSRNEFSALLPKVRALVLKPTQLGLCKTLELCRIAKAQHVCPVISSSFETGVGITLLAQLAASVQGLNIAAGLDTLEWFENDLLINPLPLEAGSICMDRLLAPENNLCRQLLEEVLCLE